MGMTDTMITFHQDGTITSEPVVPMCTARLRQVIIKNGLEINIYS